MVRAVQASDIGAAAEIWLEGNLEAHGFISADYWRENFAPVKAMLAQAEMYVYEAGGEILGFVGLEDHDVAGIFVRSAARSGGIGRQLLDHVKAIKGHLELRVYRKNVRALDFYRREGFVLLREDIDEATGEREYVMLWSSACSDGA